MVFGRNQGATSAFAWEARHQSIRDKHMAWKSFYLAAGMVNTAAIPFYAGCIGAANLPDGPCIVAANHSSFLDGPLLALAYANAKKKPLHMIAYAEPFRHWLMGWILRCGKAIPFERGQKGSQFTMLCQALGWLARDEAVGIFPEGHINPRPRLGRPRPGAALLALESGAPIIPTVISGSVEAMPPGAKYPRLGRRITVRFGPSIPIFTKERDYASLPADERATMIKNLGYRIMTAIGILSGRERHA